MFLNVEMGECEGCPDYSRSIEIYSNKDTGCGTEFYIESTDDSDSEDNGEQYTDQNDDQSPGQNDSDAAPPTEDGSTKIIIGGYVTLASAAIMALY